MITVACANCGTEKGIKPSDARRFKKHFCNRECYKKWVARKEWHICKNCGQEFPVNITPADIKRDWGRGTYCSRKCRVEWNAKNKRGKESKLWIDKIKRICPICGKEFMRQRCDIKRGLGTFCSKKCQWEAMLRDQNRNWNGGSSFEPYPIFFNRAFKERIRERDSRICQICGKTEEDNGKLLCVHHIDYNKENLDPFNHIALCEKDHLRTNYDREFWKSYLRELVIDRDHIARSFSE